MRNIVVILDGALGNPDDHSHLQAVEGFKRLASVSQVELLSPHPMVESREALWLGLPPSDGQLRQGPLTISALGADPPERSIHFHLSLLACQDGVVSAPTGMLTAEQEREVWAQLQRLNTPKLTGVKGSQVDHGLVWEQQAEFHTTGPAAAAGKPYRSVWPDGEQDQQLRRYIEDSFELLTRLEFNQRRIGDGLAPFNLAWPWGHGYRLPVPNLALRYGHPVSVFTGSLRLKGLARLCGLRPQPGENPGLGLKTNFEAIFNAVKSPALSIVVFGAPAEFRATGELEELDWYINQFGKRFLEPLLDFALENKDELTVIASPSSGSPGLSARLADAQNQGAFPFDERTVDERKVKRNDLSLAVKAGLVG